MDDIPTYKIILLGEVGVGKTSLFTRITTGKFCDDHSSFTRSLDYYQYDTRVGKDRIKVRIIIYPSSLCNLIIILAK